jgi:type I restriction enzyme S subunit
VSKWLFRKARDLVTFRTGKLDSNAAEANGKYPFFTCSQETYRINSFAFDTECVLLAGNNAAAVFPLKYFKGKFNAYQRTYVIETKDADALDIRYFYFFLRPYLEAFKQHATGATTKFLTMTILNNIEVALPSISTQKKIASILSAYDDLIENNKRRIAILEKMAEEIYREWFVRMRFSSYAKATADKPASKKNSGKLLPEKWIHKPLGELCLVIKRGVSPSYDDKGDGIVINQRCIRDQKLNIEFAQHHNTRVPAEKFLKHADVLINSTGVGTLGRVAPVDFVPEGLTVDSHVTICRADEKEIDPFYLAHTIMNLQSYFEYIATGSTGQVELGRTIIAATKIVVPARDAQDKFAGVVAPIWKLKHSLMTTNKNLTYTRDLLLPRLISGKLSVEDLELPSNEKLTSATSTLPQQEPANA